MHAGSTTPTVSSLMTRSPVVVADDDAIAGVAELLAGYEITGLPVVDATGRLVGVTARPISFDSEGRPSRGPVGTD